jgi:D-alanyl-D-alanine carboxypeptidase
MSPRLAPSRSVLVIPVAAVLAAALLASCSSASPDASASRTPSTSPVSAGPTPTPSPSPESPLPEPESSPAETEEAPPASPTPPAFDTSARSIDDPSSLWVVSDKLRPLDPVDYAPTDLVTPDVASQNPPTLRAEVAAAVVEMFAAGEAEGAGAFQVQSAYRSYATQVEVYGGYVQREGQAAADAQSARPGFSEHQTGLAVDISPVPLSCPLKACFGDTPQGRWLADNAWRFGFLLRYPADKVEITGFMFEPWHFRYIGTELSTEMHEIGVTTLEEFFGLPAAPDYAG